MKLVLRFWNRLIVWSGALLALLAALSLATGQPAAEVAANLPVWAGLALALAAFPAGISVAFLVFPHGRFSFGRVVPFVSAAALTSVAMFALGNTVGPRLASATAHAELNDAATMTLGELRDAIAVSTLRAETAPDADKASAWQDANALAWNYVRRTDGVALPFLFALIGALAGFWAPRLGPPKFAQLQLWAMGLFLLMSTYLAGENSYELIVLRSAGPMDFAGDMVLIVPLVLLVGLGWPTMIVTWRAES